MPSVSILEIADEVVGPHLQLMRFVCEPKSRSKPHVTVRYFDKLRVPAEHLNTRVTRILIDGPGRFAAVDKRGTRRHTVFLSCMSEELLPLEHKPHFPASELHLTLYDGPSQRFADLLLGTLKSLDWGFRLALPPDTRLKQIRIGSKPKAKSPAAAGLSDRAYDAAQNELFRRLCGHDLTQQYLRQLTDEERLAHVYRIGTSLSRATSGLHRVRRKRSDSLSKEIRAWHRRGESIDVHLTPPELAFSIADQAVAMLPTIHTRVRFGDPAVGAGAFFAALSQIVPRNSIENAIGVDISPLQVEAARWRWAQHGMKVVVGDYLHMENLPRRNLILANPPYLRHQQIRRPQKLLLRARAAVLLGRPVSARSGQYVYFMLLSHAWMEDDAVAAWLIPSEFMQSDYGDALRYYLTHLVTLERIHLFAHDTPQFENAAVLPCVVFFRKVPPSPSAVVEFSDGMLLARSSTARQVTVRELRQSRNWNIPERAASSAEKNPVLGELFDVKRGIATGANDFFVMERSEARALGIPNVAVQPLLPKARYIVGDVIEPDDDGHPLVDRQLVVIDCDLPETEIERRYPKFALYLSAAEEHGVRRSTLVRSRSPWYKQERRAIAPFVCTYMGRGTENRPPIRFLWNRSKATATNTYLLLYPKPAILRAIAAKPAREGALFRLLQHVADNVLRGHYRTHAHGLRKIEPGDLVRAELPNSPAWVRRLVKEARFDELKLEFDS